jgi:hypothetical protein
MWYTKCEVIPGSGNAMDMRKFAKVHMPDPLTAMVAIFS